LVNISGINGNVRNIACLELPAKLFGKDRFKTGDVIEFASTFHTHCSAYRRANKRAESATRQSSQRVSSNEALFIVEAINETILLINPIMGRRFRTPSLLRPSIVLLQSSLSGVIRCRNLTFCCSFLG